MCCSISLPVDSDEVTAQLRLYGPVALTPEETKSISSEAKVEWLHGAGSSPEVMERWLLAVPEGKLSR